MTFKVLVNQLYYRIYNRIKIKKWLPTAFFALLLFVVASFYAFSLNRPVSSSAVSEEGEILFSVNPGMSVKAIASSLERASLVKSSTFAAIYSRLKGMTLKAGTYLLSPSMTTAEILQTLQRGEVALLKVTVPEGLTISKIAALFASSGVDAEDFLAAARDKRLLAEFGIPGNSAEGYLFPETYFISYDEQAENIVRRMISTFFEKAFSLKNAPLNADSLHKKVILASIVEREYRAAKEAPLIAGVFENRLNINMRLQSCATIEYIITEIEGRDHPERLMLSDLEIESEYNTYLNAGLPPTPISNPGLTAIEAAFSPEASSYYYFRVNDINAGTHTFTASLDDHIKAGREFYLKAQAGK